MTDAKLLHGPALAAKQVIAVSVGFIAFVVASIGEIAVAAGIAGVFTLLNTLLNFRLSRHLKRVRQTAHESTKEIVSELQKVNDGE